MTQSTPLPVLSYAMGPTRPSWVFVLLRIVLGLVVGGGLAMAGGGGTMGFAERLNRSPYARSGNLATALASVAVMAGFLLLGTIVGAVAAATRRLLVGCIAGALVGLAAGCGAAAIQRSLWPGSHAATLMFVASVLGGGLSVALPGTAAAALGKLIAAREGGSVFADPRRQQKVNRVVCGLTLAAGACLMTAVLLLPLRELAVAPLLAAPVVIAAMVAGSLARNITAGAKLGGIVGGVVATLYGATILCPALELSALLFVALLPAGLVAGAAGGSLGPTIDAMGGFGEGPAGRTIPLEARTWKRRPVTWFAILAVSLAGGSFGAVVLLNWLH